jgi:aminocarboxymuconate-semialdehyde decarboxylase
VLGTDFPYEAGALFQRAVDYVREAGLDPSDAARILDVNAAEIFGLAPIRS